MWLGCQSRADHVRLQIIQETGHHCLTRKSKRSLVLLLLPRLLQAPPKMGSARAERCPLPATLTGAERAVLREATAGVTAMQRPGARQELMVQGLPGLPSWALLTLLVLASGCCPVTPSLRWPGLGSPPCSLHYSVLLTSAPAVELGHLAQLALCKSRACPPQQQQQPTLYPSASCGPH